MREIVRRVGRIQRLAVFESTARLGSFTAGARELGMTQPAVTRQIRSLEAAISIQLFRRTSNRSELTDAGRSLFRRVSEGFTGIEQAIVDLSQRGDVFVLACNPGFAQQWLVPRLEDLQHTLDGTELRLWLFDRSSELDRGHFDAAIQVGSGEFPGVNAHRLFEETVYPVASPSLAKTLSLTKGTKPKALLDGPLLHMDDGDRPWMSWTDWFAHHNLILRHKPGRIFFNNYPMVLQQALAGRGIALGWRELVNDLIGDGVLMRVGPTVCSERGYFLTWPKGDRTETVSALMNWMLTQTNGSEA